MGLSSVVPGAPRAGDHAAAAERMAPLEQWLAEFRASHPPHTSNVAGREWRYLAGGAGARPLLLLHGSHSDGESLFGLMSRLERTSRVIAPTYPEGIDRVVDVVEGLVGLLDALQAPSALVVGYSLGGYIAQALAWRHPSRVAGLALLHSGAPEPRAARMAAFESAMLALTPTALVRTGAGVGVSALLTRDAPGLSTNEATFWRRYLTGMARRVGKRRMCAHARLVVDFLGARAIYPAVSARAVPTLLVHGGRDHTIEPGERRALDTVCPQATRVTLPDAGHLSVLTAPDPYGAAIESAFGLRPRATPAGGERM